MAVLSSEIVHGTTIAIDGRAVMLCGVSGSGKSDLALRLIDRGAILVSDDYTLARRVAGRLIASSAPNIAGKIEVRGIGIVEQPHISDVPIALVVELFDVVDRMPAQPMIRTIAGIGVPVMKIAPKEASAPLKVELALKTFGLASG